MPRIPSWRSSPRSAGRRWLPAASPPAATISRSCSRVPARRSSSMSELYQRLFGDEVVAAQLSDRARVQAMLDVEVALSEVEAELGIVPASCVAPIRAAARAELYDLGALGGEAALAGNLAIPLLRQLGARVAAADEPASRYVHWGATSQDVIDTALVLQLRAAVPEVAAQLQRGTA